MIRFFIFQIRLKSAIYKADFLHKHTGRQYWVVKLFGRLIVTDRQRIKTMKTRRLLTKEFDFMKLNEIALYKTK